MLDRPLLYVLYALYYCGVHGVNSSMALKKGRYFENTLYPKRDGTWSANYNDSIVLYWDQNKFKRTIPLTPNSKNV